MPDTALNKALLEHHSFHLGPEEQLVKSTLVATDCPFDLGALSQVQRGRIRAGAYDLVVGSIPFVKAALKQLGIPFPEVSSYPPALLPFLHRQVWCASATEVRSRLNRGSASVFVKPKSELKAFTGFVLESAEDYRFLRVPGRRELWCSDVVAWRSEWRAYVCQGALLHLGCYDGDSSVILDLTVVHAAIDAFESAGAPQGYALDFGVLDDGATAVVEVNDGFSIGAYDAMPGEAYVQLLRARWRELVAKT